MHSKNKARMTRAEAEHVAAVKMLPCSVCGADGPSDAHEPAQGLWFVSIALCRECHTGYNGWHGTKALWKIRKMGELEALAVTVQRLLYGFEGNGG